MKLRTFAFFYSLFFMLLLASMLLVYREYVSLPQIKQALEAFQKRELSTLSLAFGEQISFLKTINYDYSVWTASYQFMQEFDQSYLDDNYLPDTFTSLKIDGVIFYDTQGKIVWHRGFDYTESQDINWPASATELDTPKLILPSTGKGKQVNQSSGFMSTKKGVISYAATEIRKSDRSGETPGFLVFLRKIRPDMIQQVANMAQLEIKAEDRKPSNVEHAYPLSALLGPESYQKSRIRYIEDNEGKPVMWLVIHHNVKELPVLFDQRTLLMLALLIGVPFVFMLFISTYMVRPIVETENHIKSMVQSGKLAEIRKRFTIEEIRGLVLHFNNLVLKLKAYHASLNAMSLTDQLTCIPNRRAYEQFALRAWNRMQRRKTPLGLIICDIDYFKLYNDNFGHAEGDKALLAVAHALHTKINRADDLVARYGGEEFVIVLENSSQENLISVCNIIQKAIDDLTIPHSHSLCSDHITLSVGGALFDDFSSIPLKETHEFLVRQADSALYQAKADGRSCSRIFQSNGNFLSV